MIMISFCSCFSPVSGTFPVLLQLPNGQTMPVAIPASITSSSVHIPTAIPVSVQLKMFSQPFVFMCSAGHRNAFCCIILKCSFCSFLFFWVLCKISNNIYSSKPSGITSGFNNNNNCFIVIFDLVDIFSTSHSLLRKFYFAQLQTLILKRRMK